MPCEITFETADKPRTPAALREFLESRRWYEIGDRQADYVDEDTGVTFELGWRVSGEELAQIEFSMPFLRPRFFALEAAGELEALVAEFGLAPRDGSEEGDLGTFEADDFLDGFDRGNHAAVVDREQIAAYTAPTERLRDAWRWNRARQEYQTVLGEGIFVPTVRFLAGDRRLYRGCAWPETIPFALPQAADLVLLSGIEHEGLTSEESALRVAERQAVDELITSHAENIERRDDPTRHLLVGWSRPPAELLRDLAEIGDPGDERELVPVSPDEVIGDGYLEGT